MCWQKWINAGDAVAGYLWDREQQSFRGPIFLLVNKKVVLDFATALCDGQEVVVCTRWPAGDADQMSAA